MQKYKFSHLGTWPIFIWELGSISFGNLAQFRLGTWQKPARRVGEIFKTQKNNAPFHQIVVLLSAQIRWTASCLAVTQSDKEVSKSRVPKSRSPEVKKQRIMIKENLLKIKETLPESVTLVAVSKTKPVSDLQEAYDAGQRVFGENHALEMRDKHVALPQDIQWHFIGHLQTNKIKYIISFVTLIHSIDSANLLEAVNKEAKKHDRVVDCLLQFHIAQEETKFGLDLEEARQLLDSEAFKQMENVRICGVMGMATFTDDEDEVRKEFKHLKAIFDTLKHDYFANQPQFKEISMGMSDDYPIAVEEGATMVRVGSKIFGARNYN